MILGQLKDGPAAKRGLSVVVSDRQLQVVVIHRALVRGDIEYKIPRGGGGVETKRAGVQQNPVGPDFVGRAVIGDVAIVIHNPRPQSDRRANGQALGQPDVEIATAGVGGRVHALEHPQSTAAVRPDLQAQIRAAHGNVAGVREPQGHALRVIATHDTDVHLHGQLIGAPGQIAAQIQGRDAIGRQFKATIAVARRHGEPVVHNAEVRSLPRRGAAGAAQPVSLHHGRRRARQPVGELIVDPRVQGEPAAGRITAGHFEGIGQHQSGRIGRPARHAFTDIAQNDFVIPRH
ncbi:MAG: hypothetical protein BWX84_02613 [Verrucomicrobia bacterium ADurb.Bin118]|nr:MAG: hypothetical protein BWX84_02613 [Verrucomicrobia bacterium ADurb.Bin118]